MIILFRYNGILLLSFIKKVEREGGGGEKKAGGGAQDQKEGAKEK